MSSPTHTPTQPHSHTDPHSHTHPHSPPLTSTHTHSLPHTPLTPSLSKHTDKFTSFAKYSGKQRAPTWTKLLACGLRGLIYYLSKSFLGANNDPAVYAKRGVEVHKFLRPTEAMAGDMAFEFINHSHKIFTTMAPSAEGAVEYNAEFVPIRLVVENVLGVLKQRWHILQTIFRHDKDTHAKVWYVACSIHNQEILTGKKELRSDIFFIKNQLHNK